MFDCFGKAGFDSGTKVDGFIPRLREGKLCASACASCKHLSFPPRADCPLCLSDKFDWVVLTGLATVYSFTSVHAAPAVFEDMVPYLLGLADLDEGGRLMAWFDESLAESDIYIGMKVRVVVKELFEPQHNRLAYILKRSK